MTRIRNRKGTITKFLRRKVESFRTINYEVFCQIFDFEFLNFKVTKF